MVLRELVFNARLEEQATALRSIVVATERNVEARRRAVESSALIVAQHQAQVKVCEKATEEVVASSEAAIESAKNKLESELAAISGLEAIAASQEALHNRNAKLFEQQIISEVNAQLSEQEFLEAKLNLDKAQAALKAAEKEVVGKERERKAKRLKAIAETDYAQTLLLTAQGSLAKAESELAEAEVDLVKVGQDLLAAETQLTRQENVLIVAPVAGIVTNLFTSSSTRIVKAGDVICILQPTVDNQRSHQNPPLKKSVEAKDIQTEAEQRFDIRDRVNIAGRSTAALSAVDSIETAVSLGQRFRNVHVDLPPGSRQAADANSQAARDLTAALVDRETAISVLMAERTALKKQNRIQAQTLEATRRQTEIADVDPPGILSHELSLLASTDELNRLDLLLAYYRDIGDRITGASFDSKLATATIKQLHDTAQKRCQLLSQQTQIARRAFELGDNEFAAVTAAEQAEAAASADLQTTVALLKHYSPSGPSETADRPSDATVKESD